MDNLPDLIPISSISAYRMTIIREDPPADPVQTMHMICISHKLETSSCDTDLPFSFRVMVQTDEARQTITVSSVLSIGFFLLAVKTARENQTDIDS
ncbi:MAG: hypothetical protein ABIK15_10405 [Pseudomonadota bacterium]